MIPSHAEGGLAEEGCAACTGFIQIRADTERFWTQAAYFQIPPLPFIS